VNLSGNIPSSLGQCLQLLQLNLSSNRLDGFLSPKELFAGPPLSLGMDLSHNNLKGEIPEEISQLDQIVLLNLSNNLLTGGIPTTFTHLLSIQYINLSRNGLSGSVPVFLGHLTMLEELDLSYNNFEGGIPASGIFLNSSVVHLYGNKRLCPNFSMQAFPPCLTDTKTKKNLVLAVVLVPAIIVASLLLLFCLFSLWKKMVHTPPLHIKILNLLHLAVNWIGREVFTVATS